jgi:hypothetical protein
MANDSRVPFARRFGFDSSSLVLADFPKSARVGLWHVLSSHAELGRIDDRWKGLRREIERIARVGDQDGQDLLQLLLKLPWSRVFVVVERVFGMLTETTVTDGDEVYAVPLDHVRSHYHKEINQLFGEEGIGYELRDGVLVRPGRPSTQKAEARAAHVLADPELSRSRAHFVKAQKFFASGPLADHENAVKEAVSALEAAAKALLPGPRNALLPELLRRHRGTTADKIPPTLVNAIEAVYDFRGAADGVAHGGADGGVATPAVAEWVLSQVAAHITYLADYKNSLEQDVPF